jgi:hypothetical protein
MMMFVLVMALAAFPPSSPQDGGTSGAAHVDVDLTREADAVPAGLGAEEWGSIRAAYDAARRSTYAVEGGFEARNPGQDWTTSFDGHGFRVEPDAGGWSWGLQLMSYGFAGAPRAVTRPVRVSAEGGHVAYQWDHDLAEWYINDTRGLEHGYTLHRRPVKDAATDASSLEFTLAVRGNLRPEVTPDGRGIGFVGSSGAAVLNYSGLTVFDADGHELDARFEHTNDQLLLLIDERGARYPLTIDPIAQQAYLKASNSESSDSFGSSVAVSDNTVVVGAPLEDSSATGVNGNQSSNSSIASGAAYVFIRSGTTWTQEAYLKASNNGMDDTFGSSVAIWGDTVVVGAREEDSNATGVNGNQNDDSSVGAGAAYVFVRNGTVWSQQAYLKASNTGAVDHFGSAVAVSADTVVIGAPQEASSATGINGNQNDNSELGAGAVYVFVRTGTNWSQQAFLKASNTEQLDFFGASVAIFGGTVVVGATFEDSDATGANGNQSDNSAGESGAAYVFRRNANLWFQESYLKASNTNAGDSFGTSVAVWGDTAVIGAIGEDSNATGINGDQGDDSAVDAGAAYVFIRAGGSTWGQEAYLKASNADAGDRFGGSVAAGSQDLIAVGDRDEASAAIGVNGDQADNTADLAGAVYVFTRSGTWTQEAYVKASNTDGGDRFGTSIGMSGSLMVVGASREDSNATGVNGDQSDDSSSNSGAAYVFDLDSITANYCPPTPNSAGLGATMSFVGSTSVSANDLGFVAGPMAVGEPGLFYYGPDQIQVPFGNGNRCVGGGAGTIVRIFPFATASASGLMSSTLDNTGPTHAQVVPGATLNFQAWFRDPAGGGIGFNLSDALSVSFVP